MKYVRLLLLLKFVLSRTALSFTTPKSSATTGSSSRQRWCQQSQATYHQTHSRSIITTKLHAAIKLVYKWRVLPSGSLTGICDDGIITTSALQQPATAKSNAIVATASGSQYKLMGNPVGDDNPFIVSSSSSSSLLTPSASDDDADTALTTISFVVLLVVSGIFSVVVLQKLGLVGSSLLILEDDIFTSITKLSGRTVGLITYSIGILMAAVQLVKDANKLSKS